MLFFLIILLWGRGVCFFLCVFVGTITSIFLRVFPLGRLNVSIYEMEIITVTFTCLPEFSAVGSQKIEHMECAL